MKTHTHAHTHTHTQIVKNGCQIKNPLILNHFPRKFFPPRNALLLKAQHSENEDHGIWSHQFTVNAWVKSGNSDRFYFLGIQNHCVWWLQPWNKKTLAHLKKRYDKPRQHIKKQRHHFADEGPSNQRYGFSSSHVWLWEQDHKEGWALKNWCFLTVVLEKTLKVRRSNQSILKEITLNIRWKDRW